MTDGEEIAESMARGCIRKAVERSNGKAQDQYKTRNGQQITFDAEWNAEECTLSTQWKVNGKPTAFSMCGQLIDIHLRSL